MRDTVVRTQIIRDAVQLACRAPSLHNSQPWRWVAAGRTVELFVVPDRAPRHTDTSGREALISCGAALDHFRVAMAAAGWTANVDRFPNPNDLHHLASIDFSPIEFVTDGHRLRAGAILLRRTDRLPFATPPAWNSFEAQSHVTVDAENVRFDVVADELRPDCLRHRSSPSRFACTIPLITLNWNGGHRLSRPEKVSPTVRWCRRLKAIG